MKYDIFISYSRKDTAIVEKFADKFSQAKYKYWMDVDGVEIGDEFKRKIVSAIKESKVFLFFSSEASNSSSWTVKEVNVAVMLKKPIIPIKLDNAVYDDSLLFDLAGLDFIECSSDDKISSSIQKLMRSLKNKIGPGNNGGSEDEPDVKEPTDPGTSKDIDEFLASLESGKVKTVNGKQEDDSETVVVPVISNDSEKSQNNKPFNKKWLAIAATAIIAVAAVAFGVNWYGDYHAAEQQRMEATKTRGTINGYAWVDLGLPSGIKWATCNVGASSPEGYGDDYYAWGETSTKSDYSSSTCTTYGKEMSDIGGNATYDVARKQWGSSWRLPTNAEFEELLDSDNCTWEWTTQSGVNGCKVTSKKNGNSIFLPAAGYRNGTSLYGTGSRGYYWSSTPYGSNTNDACYLYFSSGYHYTNWSYRYYGRSVRPVSE